MKLLLTSGGITNKSIASALVTMLDMPHSQANIAFIPTAANAELGDKRWLIDDLINLKNVGFKEIDIVDISALDIQQWLPRLERANILIVGGGSTPHLSGWLTKPEIATKFLSLLNARVYVGISAGSIVAGRRAISLSKDLYDEDEAECLNIVDLIFLPHLNSESFPNVNKENILNRGNSLSHIYALDDSSALRIIDGEIDVVSEGDWFHKQ